MRASRAERSQHRVERVLALRAFPGLAVVEHAHLAVMADVAVEQTFAEGDTLLRPGEPVRAMHLIRSGEVSVFRDGMAMRRFGAGDIVGAIAAIARTPDGQHVVATLETRTFEIDLDDFEEVLEESFSLLLAALRGTFRSAIECRRAIPEDAGYSAPVSTRVATASENLGLVEKVLFLRRLLTYGRATVEALAELAREMPEVRVTAGAPLWHIGDPSPYSLLVRHGVVACRTTTGQSFFLGPESVVGGLDSIAKEPRWYDATAETDVVVLRSDAAHLMDVLEDHPDMGIDMLRSAARILSDLYTRVDRIALDSRG